MYLGIVIINNYTIITTSFNKNLKYIKFSTYLICGIPTPPCNTL